jgi:hypothetical protein
MPETYQATRVAHPVQGFGVDAKAQSVSGPEQAAVMQENIPGAGGPVAFALSFHTDNITSKCIDLVV